MKRKLCLALSAVMLAGSLSGCSGGTSGLPGDTSKASEAPAGKEAEGTKGESAAGEAGEKPYAGTTIRVPVSYTHLPLYPFPRKTWHRC